MGNIGGDGSDCRDMLLELDVMDTLLNMMQQPQKRWRRGKNTSRYLAKNESVSLSMKRTIIWTISNLCRGKPQPEFDIVPKSTSLHSVTVIQMHHLRKYYVVCFSLHKGVFKIFCKGTTKKHVTEGAVCCNLF